VTDDPTQAVLTIPNGEQVQIKDLLINMFLRQITHMTEYNNIYRSKGLSVVEGGQFGNINNPAVQAKIRESAAYCIEELYEAIGLLKNKPWKQTARETDREDFYKELADAWHFWLELMIYAGMSPDLVQQYYFNIADNNDQRRAEGY
jgi:hypothetical protein